MSVLSLPSVSPTGPSLHLSYRPNDPHLPFSLSLRTGLGPLGSPTNAPFSISADFSLLPGSGGGAATTPTFSLLLKPRFGDFALKNSIKSTSPAAAIAPKLAGADGEEMEVVGLRSFENGGSHKPFSISANGLTANVAAAAAAGRGSGIGGLISGLQLTARSVLPLLGRAAMRFQWGLRVPPELQAALSDDGRKVARTSVPISKLPLLVMNKISIEQLPRQGKKESKNVVPAAAAEATGGEGTEGFSLVKRQLEALQVESAMLRRTVEDMRAEIANRRPETITGGGEVIGRADIGRRGTPPPLPPVFKGDRQANGRELPENAGKVVVGTDNVSEELKKALDARNRK